MSDDTNDPTNADLTPAERELDDVVTRLAQSYHRPPDIVPADEMWARIQQRRNVARPSHRHPGWYVLAASAAFLAIGIGIGRGWRPSGAPSAQRELAARVAVGNDAENGAAGGERQNGGTGVAGRGAGNPTLAESHPPRAARSAVPAAPVGTRADAGASTAYQLATIRHFTEVEALLTSFESSQRDARMDAQLAAWGRDLLGQTRLLLDSPAANDPARRKLLQDLELVLVQITQLSPSTAPVERDMINGAVRSSDVMPRLRTAVPAGGATHFNGV
ncbi:MAG TPA: hypothetical protein VGT98_03820 [Candidatus Elarobacter sp.]|nr:hypothetical protein [Candidatus Elarobacter sp.]